MSSATAHLRVRARRFALLLGGTAAIALSAGEPVRAIVINDQVVGPQQAAVANYFDSTNVYSNVGLISVGCTGTLINSRTVLTAAHCFINNNGGYMGGATAVSFGADVVTNPNPLLAVSTTIPNQGYRPNANNSVANDIALISLATPITNIAPATLLTANPGSPGFPPTNAVLALVGYGNFGTGSQPPTANGPNDGKRRVANTQLGGYVPEQTLTTNGLLPIPNGCTANNTNCITGFSGQQPFFASQFRNPQNPALFNYFGQNANPPPLQGGTAPGDSGGPLYWCPAGTPNQCSLSQLVLVGELFGGNAPAGATFLGYGDVSAWTPVNLFASWIAQNDPLRLVTANTGNFNWSNPAAWTDSVLGQTGFAPDNTVVYNQAAGSNFTQNTARYYDVTLSSPGTVTLDMDPTIDTLAISGAQSQLVLPAGFTLTTVLSTTLSAGTLAMTGGTLDSPEMLISGGLLTGNGTIVAAGGNTGVCDTGVCNTGGTVMPVGTLTIQGNYTQTGGVLAYQLSPTGASGTLAVQGTANLGGTLGVTVLPGLYPISTQYAVLTASSGVNGQFAQISSSGSIFLSVATTYNPTSVDLTVNRTPFGAVPGENENQRAVGNALEAAYSTSLTGQQAAFFLSVLASPTTNILTELSGESNTGAERAAFQLTNEFLTLMLDPFVNGRGYAPGGPGGGSALGFAPDEQTSLPPDVALAYASILNKAPPKLTFDQRWTAWGSAYGGSNSANGNAAVGSNNVTANAFGFAGGMDYHLSPYSVVGFALGGAGTNWGLANALGTGRSDAFQVGVYGINWFGPAYLAGALSFSNHWFTTNRSVLGDQLTATFLGQSYGARIEGGYRYAVLSAFGVTPYGAVQFQDFHTPVYSESQSDLTSGGFGLSYNAMNATDVRTELGSRFDAPTLVYGKPLVLYGRVAWAHDFVSNPALNAVFQTLPGTNFTVLGAAIPQDSALASAGAQLFLSANWSLIAKFDGEFAPNSQTYAGTGTLRYTW
jgi:uncharacterized protein with beta-barrel porin domain